MPATVRSPQDTAQRRCTRNASSFSSPAPRGPDSGGGQGTSSGSSVLSSRATVASKSGPKKKNEPKTAKTVRGRSDVNQPETGKEKQIPSQSVGGQPSQSPGDTPLVAAEAKKPDAVDQGARAKVKEVGKLDDEVFKPFGPPSRTSSTSDAVELAICTGGPSKPCGKPVTADDEGIMCDSCDLWFHDSCQSVSETEMIAHKLHKSRAWLCSGCKPETTKTDETDHHCEGCTRLENRIRFLEEALSEQAKLLMKVSDGQDELVKTVKGCHEMLESAAIERSHISDETTRDREEAKRQESYASIVKGSCVEVIKSISSKIESIPKEQKMSAGFETPHEVARIVDNVFDKEKRKNNIVVHNLPEAEANSHAERMEQDRSKFTQLVKDEFHLIVRVTKSFRIGKAVAGKNRLLIVTVDGEESKWDILRQAPRLRHSELWPRVYLSPDLTRSESEEGRKLREELKRRKDSGEQNLMIKNHRIVEIRKENDVHKQNLQEVPPQQSEPQPSRSHQETKNDVNVNNSSSSALTSRTPAGSNAGTGPDDHDTHVTVTATDSKPAGSNEGTGPGDHDAQVTTTDPKPQLTGGKQSTSA